ncbi:MAG TPA: hypothetical protein VHF26_02020, partial [Trebonia sp.]|nr:hypothetical protein [Trebonia sp.]
DALTRIKMHGLLRQLCRRHHPAVLLVTHDVDEAITLADRIVVLADGRLSLDIPVSLPGGRHRDHPETAALRARLLAELGAAEFEPTGPEPGREPGPAVPAEALGLEALESAGALGPAEALESTEEALAQEGRR